MLKELRIKIRPFRLIIISFNLLDHRPKLTLIKENENNFPFYLNPKTEDLNKHLSFE